eukprot:m.23956 g.23956  ORF g.23956 m.23956 type:complete len:112 (+) comp3952_c0_seq1:79-414(+)
MASRDEKLAALKAARERRESDGAAVASPPPAAGDDREAKLAALRAARGREVPVSEDVLEKNKNALVAKKVDSFSQQASAAGMDISMLDPSVRAFLAGTIKPEEMVSKRETK